MFIYRLFLVSFLLVVQLSGNKVFSQDQVPVDQSSEVYYAKRSSFWRPAGELLIAELIPFTFNYISKTDFSRVGLTSIKNNLSIKNWEFDVDKFLTNQFAHPYHGNLYFNTFRSTGHTFWQSGLATLSGSLLWEIAGENTYPSYNDIVNTTLGGIALGEMTHRFAGLLINNKRKGGMRQVQEIFATAINPVSGLNRIIDKQWGKVYPQDPEDDLFVELIVDGGIRRVSKQANQLIENARNEMYGAIRLRYGDPFEDYRKPFDNFYILVEAGAADSGYLNSLWVQGALWGKITGGGEQSINMLRLTMNYDFYKNTAFEYGGQSLLLTWASTSDWGRRWRFSMEIGGGATILAASPDYHRDYKDARNYTYGSGVGFLGLAELSFLDRLYYRVNYRSNWTATINGSSSSNALHLISSELRFRFFKHFTITGSWGNFKLLSFYPGFENSDETFPFLRASLGYRVTL